MYMLRPRLRQSDLGREAGRFHARRRSRRTRCGEQYAHGAAEDRQSLETCLADAAWRVWPPTSGRLLAYMVLCTIVCALYYLVQCVPQTCY